MMTKIEKLRTTRNTVFSVDDLAIYWQISERTKLWSLIRYYLRTQRLTRIHSGIYAFDHNYSNLELATKLLPPAYISFHTALGIYGINFQQHQTIHAMALASKKIRVDNQQYSFHQIKDHILFNEMGVYQAEQYRIATAERAICDSLYLEPGLTFDNLENVDLAEIQVVAGLYNNKSLEKRVARLAKGATHA